MTAGEPGRMTNIKILGWVHVVLNGLLLAAGLALCVALMLSPDKESRAAAMIVPMFATMALWLLVPGLVGGIGLLYTQPWARILIIVLSLMHVFLFPIGTVLGGFGLWILLGADAKTAFGDAAVRTVMDDAARLAPGASPQPFMGTGGLLLAIAGVGAGFIVVIGAGFMISGDPAPVEIMDLFYPALGVLIVVLGFAARAIVQRTRT
jgi:hypothetical protein